MKREIKFRGKDPKGGWVEGYYLQDLTQGKMRSYIFHCPLYWEVIPKTVGQFTGLLDKNGKEIYEGDVIIEKVRRARKDGERLVICFDDFEWQGKNANGATTSLSLLFEYHTVEVIGNIHDNPELLKGGEE